MKNIWLTALFLLYFFPIVLFSGEKITVNEALSIVEPNDREVLESFFRNLFIQGDFAYTLFGNKPIAACDHNLNLALNHKDLWYSAIINFKGAVTWKKYENFFPSQNYIFSVTENLNDDLSFSIQIINLQKSLEIINDNLSIFQRTFGHDLEAKAILEKISFLLQKSEITKNDYSEYHLSLGLLFGYGKINSEKFQQREIFSQLLSSLPIETSRLNSVDLEKLYEKTLSGKTIHLNDEANESPLDLVKKLNVLRENSKYAHLVKTSNPLSFYRTPGFVTFNNEMDNSLLENLSEQMVNIYYSDDFLQIILMKLTGET